jgi:hypothetical protein
MTASIDKRPARTHRSDLRAAGAVHALAQAPTGGQAIASSLAEAAAGIRAIEKLLVVAGFDGSALILATDWKPIVWIEQERKKARAWG